MTGKTHLLGGIAVAAGMLCLVRMPLPVAAACSAAAVLGSLLPDIDKKGSKISKRTEPLGTLIRLFFSHRGLLHDPTLYALLFVLLYPLAAPFPFAVLILCALFGGIGSHLLLDAITPMGVPVLLLDLIRVPFSRWRLKRRKYRILALPSGGLGERVVRMLLLLLICLLILSLAAR